MNIYTMADNNDKLPTTQQKEEEKLLAKFQQYDTEIQRVDSFTNLQNIDNADFLRVLEVLKRPPRQVLYPKELDTKFIQKCIVDFNIAHMSDGPMRKNQYVSFPAYSLWMYYQRRVISEHIPFILQLPVVCLYNMFAKSAKIDFGTYMQQLMTKSVGRMPLIEMHFAKKNAQTYELLLLAHVEPIGYVDDVYQWERHHISFQEQGYIPKRQIQKVSKK